jgi:protein arginine kinase
VTNAGLDLGASLETAEEMESSLDLKPARDVVLGYLTSNPSFVGTGLTATVMFHLPALEATDNIARVNDTFRRDWNNLELEKMKSREKGGCGSFFLLSNKITLSVTPAEIVKNVSQAAQTLVSREMFARHKIQISRGGDFNDRFWRSWGLLRHAKMLSFGEAMDAFSFVKLGADIGVLPSMDNREWKRMVLRAHKYHLRLATNIITGETEEQTARAAAFRQYIENLSAAVH